MNTWLPHSGADSVVELRPASAASPPTLAGVARLPTDSRVDGPDTLDCFGIGKTPRCLAGFETICRWCRYLVPSRLSRVVSD